MRTRCSAPLSVPGYSCRGAQARRQRVTESRMRSDRFLIMGERRPRETARPSSMGAMTFSSAQAGPALRVPVQGRHGSGGSRTHPGARRRPVRCGRGFRACRWENVTAAGGQRIAAPIRSDPELDRRGDCRRRTRKIKTAPSVGLWRGRFRGIGPGKCADMRIHCGDRLPDRRMISFAATSDMCCATRYCCLGSSNERIYSSDSQVCACVIGIPDFSGPSFMGSCISR